MSNTTKPELTKRQRALAGWESAFARTINPHLTEAQSTAIWNDVITLRQTEDADAFEKALNDMLDGAPTPIRRAAETLVSNLRATLAIEQ